MILRAENTISDKYTGIQIIQIDKEDFIYIKTYDTYKFNQSNLNVFKYGYIYPNTFSELYTYNVEIKTKKEIINITFLTQISRDKFVDILNNKLLLVDNTFYEKQHTGEQYV